MLNNFIYAQEKSLFLEQLGAGNILDEAIVFIEDTGEIWNHGTYFAGDCGFDPEVIREIQTTVANLKASKQDSISDLATIRIGASAGATAVQPETLNNYVPTNRTINGKSLTNNISLSASDVGAPAIGELNTTNTNVSDLTSKVSSLTTDYSAFKQVFSDNSDEYINTWGEVKNFLDGIKNTEDLNNILLGINTQLGNKADKSQLSGYLPLSGGTISATGFTPLKIKSTDLSAGCYIDFQEGKASVGYSSLGGAFMQSASSYILLKDNDGLYWNNSSKFLHSGNIRDYAFTPQTQIVNNTDADTLLTNGVYLNATGNGSGNSNFPSTYGILMTFTQDKNYSAQISVGNGSMHVRRKIDAWSDWKTIAFTDSDITGNAASATKLQTARKLWGNSFDGTADINGDIHLAADKGIVASNGYAVLTAPSYLLLGYAQSELGQTTYLDGNDIYLRYGKNHVPAMYINASGSIGIGTASPQYKLDVNGNANVSSRLLVGNPTDSGWIPFQVKGAADIDGPLYISAYAKEGIYLNEGGIHWHNTSAAWVNALIEFSSSAVRLSKPTTVAGDLHVEGNIIADGDLHTGQWLKTSTGVAFGSAHTLTFNSYSIISNAELAFTNISTTDISTGIKVAIKAGMIQANDIIGHRIFLGNNSAETASNQAFSICKYGSVVDTAPSNITELLKVDPSGAVTINGSLSVTGNIISSDEYLGASNVLDNPEYASYPSSGSSMEMHSDIRNFVNNGTVVRKDGKLYVKDNPFAPVTTHWLDIFSDPTEIGGYNYSGPIELDLYPDRFYDFTNSLFISSIKINSIPGWDNPGLISHNIVRFRPTNTAFSLTLPSDIYWADGKPFEVDDNDAVYEMSFIVRNGGVITATWTKFTQA